VTGSCPFTSSSGVSAGQALRLLGVSALLPLWQSKRSRTVRDQRGAGTKGPCCFRAAQICVASVVTLGEHLSSLALWEKQADGFPSLGLMVEPLKTLA